MPNKNDNLRKANKAKNDEFYTQLSDIEAELQHYERHFKDKVVYCNCDKPEESNFWRYFEENFERLGLTALVSTYYSKDGDSYCTVMLEDEVRKCKLKGNGDFRSQECIDILKTADIVVTNPPFSLFREYVAQLMEYEKKFLIIGNMNAITYKEFFPLLKDNKVWLGVSIHSGDREFKVPEDYPVRTSNYRVDGDGNKYIRVNGVRWFTNIDNLYRHNSLELNKQYNPAIYPSYDNYNAINVDKTKDIPMDYDSVIGVPISFMDKYCPEQFEIVGLDRYTVLKENLIDGRLAVNGKTKYARILIKRKQ